ncbi:MAG TPA: dynamin family protein [Hyphomicrobiales bacterium]|nr:dynamin family protein [Hyphomicrobiales bacterium]
MQDAFICILDEASALLGRGLNEDRTLRLRELRRRLLAGRLQLAVVGQFKRGKSSVLNALLGAPLLPTGVVPVTAIPVFIAWGEPCLKVQRRSAEAETFPFADAAAGAAILRRFVAEEENPENRLGVTRVDLHWRAPILETGVVLIDTPGIGSTHRHNTEATVAVLPECDAAAFIVSADPPITETELAFLKEVAPQVAHLFVVLNKSDYLAPGEAEEALRFLRRTLVGQGGFPETIRIFPLSARQALAGQGGGLGEVEDYLLGYLAREKTAALGHAVAGKAVRLLDEAAADLALQIRARELPLAELEAKGVAFEEALGAIALERQGAADLLAGDRRRLMAEVEAEIARVREAAAMTLAALVDARLAEALNETPAQEAVVTAIPQVFAEAATGLARRLGADLDRVLDRHQERVEALIGRIRQTAAELFDIAPSGFERPEPFRTEHNLAWVSRQRESLNPLPKGAFDLLLPGSRRRERLRRRLVEQTQELVARNAEALRWSLLQHLDDTLRRFGPQIEARLEQALASTRGALQAALAERRARGAEADATLPRLGADAARLAAVRDALARLAGG